MRQYCTSKLRSDGGKNRSGECALREDEGGVLERKMRQYCTS